MKNTKQNISVQSKEDKQKWADEKRIRKNIAMYSKILDTLVKNGTITQYVADRDLEDYISMQRMTDEQRMEKAIHDVSNIMFTAVGMGTLTYEQAVAEINLLTNGIRKTLKKSKALSPT